MADLYPCEEIDVNKSNERWLPVVGYEGLYEVSSYGNVWSAPRATTKGGLLKHIPDKRNYQYVTLTRNGKQRRAQVHCLMLAAFVGPCPEGQEVRHLTATRPTTDGSRATRPRPARLAAT